MSDLPSKALNPLQKAYLLGRTEHMPLGKNGMHDFREFIGEFNEGNLKHRITQMVKNHHCLRTLINQDNELIVMPELEKVNWLSLDLSLDSASAAELRLDELRELVSHYKHPIGEVMWHIWFIQLPDSFQSGKAVVMTSFDGLVFDGYTIGQLIEQLFSATELPITAGLDIKPSRYFSNTDDDENFWNQQLESFVSPQALPWDKQPNSVAYSKYQRQQYVFEESDLKNLNQCSTKEKLLPNMVLTGLIVESVLQWANSDRLVFSMPISDSQLRGELGTSSNFIVTHYQTHKTFLDGVQAFQKNTLTRLSHGNYSGIEVAKKLVKLSGNLIPLPIAVTNGLSWQSRQDDYKQYNGLTQTPQLALDLRLVNTDASVAIEFDFAMEVISEQAINKIVDNLRQKLREIIKCNSLDVSFSLPVEQEKSSYRPTDFIAKIHETLNLEIDKTAIIFGDEKLSYRELKRKIIACCDFLTSKSVQRGDVLAICTGKSPEQVILTLSCASLGIIWIPIDIDSPPDRINYLLKNSQAKWVVSNQPYPGCTHLSLDELKQHHCSKEHIPQNYSMDRSAAYYLYTSGSTGLPKCVVLNNQATANVIEQSNKEWEISQQDTFFAATPFHHDMSVYDIFAPFCVGGALVIPTERQIKSAVDWAQLIKDNQISIWVSVPAIVDMLIAVATTEQIQSLRLIAQGGDYVKPASIKTLRTLTPKATLYSLGGPTETTIWSIWHPISHDDQSIIPYGKAIKGNTYSILDSNRRPCGVNETGTIVMSGINLTNGYLKDGKLIDKDFITITNELGKSEIAFQTSDQGFFNPQNQIIFAGRKEGYLKVRGVRISAAEVEHHVNRLEEITNAIVVACENPKFGQHELVCAYKTQSGIELSVKQIKPRLKAQLPISHIPSRWVCLDEFPLTRNNKIDRKALSKELELTIYTDIAIPEKDDTTDITELVFDALGNSLPKPKKLSSEDRLIESGVRPSHLAALCNRLLSEHSIKVGPMVLINCQTIGDVVDKVSSIRSI